MAVGGLFVASRAGHGVGYYGGLAFFLFAVLFVMLLIKTSYELGKEAPSMRPLRELFVGVGTFLKSAAAGASVAPPERGFECAAPQASSRYGCDPQ